MRFHPVGDPLEADSRLEPLLAVRSELDLLGVICAKRGWDAAARAGGGPLTAAPPALMRRRLIDMAMSNLPTPNLQPVPTTTDAADEKPSLYPVPPCPLWVKQPLFCVVA